MRKWGFTNFKKWRSSFQHISLAKYSNINNKMPLKKGKSKKVISDNIEELMHSYHDKGTIGTSTPETNKKAQKQAIAIAFRFAKKNK
jgi:hypothetical protein